MMNLNDFKNLTDEEKVYQIETAKNEDKKSNKWKMLTILYVTNCFDVENLQVETKFYKGKYQTVFTKMELTFDEFVKYVNDMKNTDIYDSAKNYLEIVSPKIKDEEIKLLEKRIASGVMTEEEKNHIKMSKLNKTLTKIIIAVIIAASIYMVLYMLLTMFGYSFR